MRDRPGSPPARAITRFLRNHRNVSVPETARLLRFPDERIRARALREAELLDGDRLSWDTAALWLLEAWPLSTLAEIVRGDPGLLPEQLLPIAVSWRIPAYVVRAMETQTMLAAATGEMERREVEDYVASVLDWHIEDPARFLLSHDAGFREAFDFPSGGSRY
jgi:hypothetical protein